MTPITKINIVDCGNIKPKIIFNINAVVIGKLAAPNIFKLHLNDGADIFLIFSVA